MLVIRHETPSNDDDDHPENITVGSFCHKNLSSDDVRSIFALFRKLETLNLSNNFIDSLPKGLPRTLKALNLSYNSFSRILGFENVENLVEVNLRNNRLQSTWGLGVAVSLEYLDVSFNSILAIEGLEGLVKLQVLKATNNNLKTLSTIRSLSLNKNLTTVDLSNNPVTQVSKYRGTMFNFILSLQVLDTIPTSRRPKHRTTVGYTSIFDQQQQKHSTKLPMNPLLDNQLATILPSQSPERFRVEPVSSPNKSMEAISHHIINEMAESGYDLTLHEPESPLPWRCPPDIIPRPWKGKDPYNYATSATTKMLRPKKKKSPEKKVLSKGWNRMLYKVVEEAREADHMDSLLKRPLKGSIRRQDSTHTLGGASLTTASKSTRGADTSSNYRSRDKGLRVPPSPKSASGSPRKIERIGSQSPVGRRDRMGSQSPGARSRRGSTSSYYRDDPPTDGDSKHKYKITLGRRDVSTIGGPATPDSMLDTPFSLPPQQLYIPSETSYSFPKRRAPPGHINPVPVSKHLPKQDFYEQDLSMSRHQFLSSSSSALDDNEYLNKTNDSLSFIGRPTSAVNKINKSNSTPSTANWMVLSHGSALPPFPLEKSLEHSLINELRVDPPLPIESLDIDSTPLSTTYRPLSRKTSFKSEDSYDYRQSISSSIDQYSTSNPPHDSPFANRKKQTNIGNDRLISDITKQNNSKLIAPRNYKGGSLTSAAPPPLPALSSPSLHDENDGDGTAEVSLGGQISPERMKLILALVERKKETMRILKENKSNFDVQFEALDEKNPAQNYGH